MIAAAAEVEAAADALLDAFAKNDRPRYFSAFLPEASFVFPIVDRVMLSRDEYAAEWQDWIDTDDFKVTEFQSLDRIIQIYGAVAIFIHRSITHSSGRSGERTLQERETIIFHKINDVWWAVHEHVSPLVE
jgi:ketosteroid isomerase-like protein